MKHKLSIAQITNESNFHTLFGVSEGDTIEIMSENIIDVSFAKNTRIPMMFGTDDSKLISGYLDEVTEAGYRSSDGVIWQRCEFDTNKDAWVPWGDHLYWYTGESPVPTGVVVDVILRNGKKRQFNFPKQAKWSDGVVDTDIISFRVNHIKDDWRYD